MNIQIVMLHVMMWIVLPLVFLSLWYSLLALVTDDGDVMKALEKLFKRNPKWV